MKYEVLIETYWNVNFNSPVGTGGIVRLNRNILECKFARPSLSILKLVVLIETYWNVNAPTGGF